MIVSFHHFTFLPYMLQINSKLYSLLPGIFSGVCCSLVSSLTTLLLSLYFWHDICSVFFFFFHFPFFAWICWHPMLGVGFGAYSGGVNGVFTGSRGPFTPSQWMELEHQALIYKHLNANIPIPSNLMISITRGLNPGGFSGFPLGSLRPSTCKFFLSMTT